MAESRVSELLNSAVSREAQYDWAGAADSYEKAISLISREDSQRLSVVLERTSFAKYRTARQADSQDRFDKEMQAAISSYERTVGILSHSQDLEIRPGVLRCEAMMPLLKSWITSEASEKRRLVNNSWSLALEAMNAFQHFGEPLEHWRTLSQLNLSNVLAGALETKGEARKTLAREGLEQSEVAIKNLSSGPDPNNGASAYVSAFFYIESLRHLTNPEEFEEYDNKAQAYWKKSLELSERSTLIELADFGWPSLDFEDLDKAIALWRKALGYGRETRDHCVIGKVLDNLAYLTGQKAVVANNPDDGKLLLKDSFQLAVESRHQYQLVRFKSHNPVGWVGGAEAQYFYVTARYFATSREESDTLLGQALELCPEFLRLAEETGYPEVIGYAHHVYGGTLNLLGRVQASLEKKRFLLTQALEHRDKYRRIIDEILPFHYWGRGLSHIVTAELRAIIADLTAGNEKRRVIAEAVRESEEAAMLCEKDAEIWAARGQVQQLSTLGMIQDSLGDQSLRLFELTSAKADLKRAVDAYLRASEHYGKLGISSRSAESRWKAASGYEGLAEHLRSSEEFSRASEDYRGAANRFPPLESLYRDYSIYMQAWSEIQKAKHYHARAEYGIARDYYEKTASFHKSSQRWNYLESNYLESNYLESNYLAWARLEGAEEASKNGRGHSAAELFAEAANLFKDSRSILQKQLAILDGEERGLAKDLAKAANQRLEYCTARISLEEARTLDRAGNYVSASGKFRDAASMFRNLVKDSASGPERNEMKLAETLSRAWQMMTWGEADASPEMFVKASRLFEEAKKGSSDETLKMTAIAHSHFCRGLEAGTQFVSTLNLRRNESAQKHLESAVNYYVRAGLEKLSEQARATKLLFEASMYMHEGGRHRNPAKKLRSFALAKRLLEASADSYAKADQPAKNEEVQRLLRRVLRESEVAISLQDVLRTPGMASSVPSLRAPTATHERPVGIEKFEDASIQATVLTSRTDLRMGEEFELRIELVNAGNRIAQLIRIEGVIPETLELKGEPSIYHMEGSTLNPEGRRLGPLKTETVRMVFRPTQKGRVRFSPRVLYLAESGKRLFSSSDPVELTVGDESGTIGEPSTIIRAPSEFLFETREAQSVFAYLVKAFSQDYIERRLYVDASGWRGLMDLVRDLGLPKRAVYGDDARDGRVIRELERRSLIEVRIFRAERGRGGEVKRVRVAYKKDLVKNYVERHHLEYV